MHSRPAFALAAVAIATVATALPLRIGAAQGDLQVGASAGTATDERGIRSNAVTLAPGMSFFPSGPVRISLGGTATRFQSAGWSLGGSATLATRSPEVAGTALSLNAGSGISRSSFGAVFTVADATPAVEWSAGPVTLFGGGRAAMGRADVRGAPAQPVPPFERSAELVSTSRRLLGAMYGAQWRTLGASSPWPASVTYREERSAVDRVNATERTAGATVAMGRVAISGSAGERTAVAERTQFATGTISLSMTPVVRVQASAGRYPSDRLTGTAAGRFLSAGLVFSFGDGGPRLPAPRGVEPPAVGTTRLSIRAPQARVVELYGDWNSWTPARTRRAANGVWYADIPLAPGEYRYAFRVNEVEWRVPDGAVSANDGFGGKSAYVTVTRPTANNGTSSREGQ